jgi:polysaccharide biosynthesis/export protein
VLSEAIGTLVQGLWSSGVFAHFWFARSNSVLVLAMVAVITAFTHPVHAQQTASAAITEGTIPGMGREPLPSSLIKLGPGDSVAIQVFGQPDLGASVYVSEDGTIPVNLAGAVKVAGMTPSEAARKVEAALRDGQYMNDPHVTLTVTSGRSQRVSVLGEVGSQGRYPIDSTTTIFDLLALAGGTRETSSDIVYLVRTNADGSKQRFPIDLKGLNEAGMPAATENPKGGDILFVPRAEEFYIVGEVTSPNKYRIEPNMNVMQAVARAGGVTPRGSMNRIEVERHDASGKLVKKSLKPGDPVLANDVIRIKESIF